MTGPVSILADLALGALFGGMVFFPAVVAPIVFSVLDEAKSSAFLRRFFPRYYLFVIVAAATAALALASLQARPWTVLSMAFVSLSTAWVRHGLVPRINAARDAAQSGDKAAARRFELRHRLSVIINGVQLVLVIAVIMARAL